MTRPMKQRETARRLRHEITAALRLSPLVLAALLLAAILWRSDSAATSGTFQSSILRTPLPTAPTPAETPTPFPTPPTIQPTAPGPMVTATTVPTQPTTIEPTVPAPAETPTLIPTETPPLESSATPTPTELPPTATPEPTPDESQRYPEGESDLRFQWGMLFDSISLLLSYIWLFCGILVFLAVPILFIVLWVASRRRQQQAE